MVIAERDWDGAGLSVSNRADSCHRASSRLRLEAVSDTAEKIAQLGFRCPASHDFAEGLGRMVQLEPDFVDGQPDRLRRVLPRKACGDLGAAVAWPLVEDDRVEEQRDGMAPSEDEGTAGLPSEISSAGGAAEESRAIRARHRRQFHGAAAEAEGRPCRWPECRARSLHAYSSFCLQAGCVVNSSPRSRHRSGPAGPVADPEKPKQRRAPKAQTPGSGCGGD
jgi:hypothetical protein